MRARQRLMPRKESVLDNGRKTQPLSPGRTVTGAGAQTARVRWSRACARTGRSRVARVWGNSHHHLHARHHGDMGPSG